MSYIPYLAGFFDGEGCIVIGKNGSLQVRVINTALPVLGIFQQELGGTVKPRKQKVNKPQYYWSIYGYDAVEALNKLLPHLIDKKNQAFTALEWMKERDNYERIPKIGRGYVPHPERQEVIKYYRKTLTEQKLGIYIDQ